MRREKAEPDSDERGNRIITERYVRALCLEQELYETPRLNDKLYLHYKAFNDIRNLESYINVKTLWLENNCISKIERLSHMKHLRFLYLQNNRISKIEGLEGLTELVTLNLEHNAIRLVEGLEGLVALEDFNIAHNYVTAVEDLEGLKQAPALASLDLTNNRIERPDGLLDLLGALTHLGSLYLKGNPAVRAIANYRKVLTVAIPTLQYLDDRPVFELDRLAAEAWHRGGRDEEMATRKRYQTERDDFDRRNRKAFRAQAVEIHRKKQEALEAAEIEKQALREQVAQMRKEMMDKQGAEMEAWLAQIAEAEAKIATEIRVEELVPPALKPGTVTYYTPPPDPPEPRNDEVVVPVPVPARPELRIERAELEDALMECFFDFEAVSARISEARGQLITATYLQELWTKYELEQRNPLLEELD